jgi:RNA-binding protein
LAELSGKQRRHLRALGHHLNAVVQVGHEGLNEALIAHTKAQLEAHELIKVKVGETSPLSRHEAAEQLAAACSAELAQVLGRTFLLYRRREKDPRIQLPE